MRRDPLLLLLALGLSVAAGGALYSCNTEPEPTAEPAPEPAPEPVSSETPGSATVWSAQNIDQLQPNPPSRSVVTPAKTEATVHLEQAMGRLAQVVDTYAADPDNPWAMGHGLVARGADWKLKDGTPAVDHLFTTYAEPFPVGSHTLLRFPDKRGDIRIEPHAELMLKMLTEAGVAPDRRVTVGGQSHTVMDLYRGSLLSSYLVPEANHSAFASTDDTAWALQGLAAWAPPGLVWLAVDGTPMDLDKMATFHVAVLHREMQPIAKAMAVGADFERKGQGIFRYTCGGAHLLQGTGFALARGYGSDQAKAMFTEQIDLAFYRLPRELGIYDAAMKRFGEEHADRLLVQRLKFTGHFLESMHKLAAMGFYTPSSEQKEVLDGVALQVALTTEALRGRGVFDRMAEIRKEDEQMYLDLVGDSAHALHGLLIALGDEPVRF